MAYLQNVEQMFDLYQINHLIPPFIFIPWSIMVFQFDQIINILAIAKHWNLSQQWPNFTSHLQISCLVWVEQWFLARLLFRNNFDWLEVVPGIAFVNKMHKIRDILLQRKYLNICLTVGIKFKTFIHQTAFSFSHK